MVLRALLFQQACSFPTLPRLQQIPAATLKEILQRLDVQENALTTAGALP